MFDLSIIMRPISASAPCGSSIRELDLDTDAYHQLKDKRLFAKRDERNNQEFSGEQFTKQWLEINRLCCDIIENKSKDLDVICWLIESHIRVSGFTGFPDIIEAVNALLNESWHELHPVEYDSVVDRIAGFSALNGKYGSGGLIQALRLAPLVPSASFGQYGLWDYIQFQRDEHSDRRDQMNAAAFHAGKQAMLNHMETISCCLHQINSLAETFRGYCADHAPDFSDLAQVLLEALCAVKDINSANWFITTPATANAHDEKDAHNYVEHQVGFRSRDDALAALFSVAQYFRHAEPNSPIAPALDTLLHRSRLNFEELLADLIPDEAIFTAILTATGISLQTNTEQSNFNS